MNNLLRLAFILSLHQPYHGGGAVNTPAHVLYSLAATGWYTPEARRELFRVPIVAHCDNPLSVGCFADDGLSQIGLVSFDRTVLMHEFNHYFAWRYGEIDLSPEWAVASARATSQFGYHKSRYSPSERYALMGQYPWLFPQLRQFYPQFSDAAYSVRTAQGAP